MLKARIFLLFFCFCNYFFFLFGQKTLHLPKGDSVHFDWQEQILQMVDMDQLSEESYDRLAEELSDLVLWNDTTESNPHYTKQEIFWRSDRCMSPQVGFQDQTPDRQAAGKAYLGDPWHHSFKYRIRIGEEWNAGISVEKDAGEAWRNSFPGFDSWHGYVSWQPHKTKTWAQISQAVLGHYRMRIGCGLMLNQLFSMGKQYIVQQFWQRGIKLSPYASNAESDYMQGAALDMRFGKHLSITPFISALQIDGTISDRQILTSLKTDGFHRSQTEEAHRNALWQIIMGARAGWRSEWFDIGLNVLNTQLQYDYQRSVRYYNRNYFRGHQLTQFSADWIIQITNDIIVRGEAALDDHAGIAVISGVNTPLFRYWAGSLMYRYYSPKYCQLHASALRESSGLQGEQGITAQLSGSISTYWNIAAMIDWFYFSQPQYRIQEPKSQGVETSLRTIHERTRHTLQLGYRFKKKGSYTRHSLDGTLQIRPIPVLTLKTQLHGRLYGEKYESASLGVGAGQSVLWKGAQASRCPFQIEAMVCYFDTDDYDSRVYITEKAIPYGFGLPMLYGQGLRYSATSTIKLGKIFTIDLKYALTNYANRNTLGSGLAQINGNTRHDLWVQCRVSL